MNHFGITVALLITIGDINFKIFISNKERKVTSSELVFGDNKANF